MYYTYNINKNRINFLLHVDLVDVSRNNFEIGSLFIHGEPVKGSSCKAYGAEFTEPA